MLKYFLVFSLALPLCGHSQSYADSPFYRPISAIPSSAHVEYKPHGSIMANGIIIDLSRTEWEGSSVPLRKQYAADVDRVGTVQLFHFYIQYNDVNVTFAYDLLVEPEGTDKIKCTFKPYTDPPHGTRSKGIPILALPTDLTPLVIKSGDAIAIRTIPSPEDDSEVIHFLRLTRIDLTPASDSTQ